MRLNEFSIGDVVTNNDGEIFEIKQIFSTGSVKVFVKECEEEGYFDVNNRSIRPGKTYTLNLKISDCWELISPKSSNVSNQTIKDLQNKIQDAEKTVQSLQKTISEQKSILETMKKSDKKMECWKMYDVEEFGWNFWGVVVGMTDSRYICLNSMFDKVEIDFDDVESFEEITTTKAKNICKALKEFSEMV